MIVPKVRERSTPTHFDDNERKGRLDDEDWTVVFRGSPVEIVGKPRGELFPAFGREGSLNGTGRQQNGKSRRGNELPAHTTPLAWHYSRGPGPALQRLLTQPLWAPCATHGCVAEDTVEPRYRDPAADRMA